MLKFSSKLRPGALTTRLPIKKMCTLLTSVLYYCIIFSFFLNFHKLVLSTNYSLDLHNFYIKTLWRCLRPFSKKVVKKKLAWASLNIVKFFIYILPRFRYYYSNYKIITIMRYHYKKSANLLKCSVHLFPFCKYN